MRTASTARALLRCALGAVGAVAACGGRPTGAAIADPLPAGDGGAGAPDAELGPPFAGCAAGRFRAADGACVAAGVPPENCGDGFLPDDGGCRAVLPPAPCADGEVAWLGETACHDLADCGDGPWGDAPDEPTAEYVDASAVAAASDGTRAHPWTTIGDGVAHAAAGALVAVAAGHYAEYVTIATKPVRLWGRCPRLVQIDGRGRPPASYAVVEVRAGGALVRGVDVTGDANADGVDLFVDDVSLRAVRIHDLANGLSINGPRADVREIVVDRTRFVTVDLGGLSSGTVDRLRVVGDGALPDASALQVDADAAPWTLNGCILQGRGNGVTVAAGHSAGVVTIERSLVRGTGWGMTLDGSVVVDRSVIEDTLYDAIYTSIGSIVIENTTIRGVGSAAAGALPGGGDTTGGGVTASAVNKQYAASLDLVAVRIDGAFGCALCIGAGVGVRATGVAITNVRPDPNGAAYGALVARHLPYDAALPTSLVLVGSTVDGASVSGIAAADARVTIADTAIRGTRARADGTFGDGVTIVATADGGDFAMVRSRIEGSARAGVALFGANASLREAYFGDDAIDLDGETNGARPARFDDEGAVTCVAGGEPRACLAASAGLTPPAGIGAP